MKSGPSIIPTLGPSNALACFPTRRRLPYCCVKQICVKQICVEVDIIIISEGESPPPPCIMRMPSAMHCAANKTTFRTHAQTAHHCHRTGSVSPPQLLRHNTYLITTTSVSTSPSLPPNPLTALHHRDARKDKVLIVCYQSPCSISFNERATVQ